LNLIVKAAVIAREAHGKQTRKYSADPYVLHPARVAARALLLDGMSEEAVAAAWLHDVLEDTDITATQLDNKIGTKVTNLVIGLTNQSKGSSLPRAERKKIDREWLSKQSPEVKRIKMLDRIDNLRDMDDAPLDFKRLYGQESIELAEAIGDADLMLKKELLIYAHGLADAEDSEFVLTVYLDGGGMLQFHAGPDGDFGRDIENEGLAARLLKTFRIYGNIVDEGGETEPIRI